MFTKIPFFIFYLCVNYDIYHNLLNLLLRNVGVLVMRLLSGVLSAFQKTHSEYIDKKSYVFYKIIDSTYEKNEEYHLIQCINTQAVFSIEISELVFDKDILHHLHPIQACYIGIEYAKNKSNIGSEKNQKKSSKKNNDVKQYGRYKLVSQNRNGDINFIIKKTGEERSMDPRHIALSKELISEFDSQNAFQIGFLAGIKLHNSIKISREENIKKKYNYLRVVK